MKKIALLINILIISFLALSTAFAQTAAGQAYIVQADDWLSKIAEKEYGDPLAYPAIVEATNNKAAEDDSFAVIDNPDLIEVGQKIWLPAEADSPVPSAERLTLDQLKNATYSGIYEEPVTLTAGIHEGEPFMEGSAVRPTVEFVDNSVVYGDLDGDGVEDAALLLVESSGGSGVFTYLAAQINQDGQPVDAGAVLVGDRIQVKSATIETGQIILEIVTQGPDDPLCCPGLNVRKTYALQDGQLVEIGSEALGRVSLDDLNSTTWRLVDLDFDRQPVWPEATITITFQDGQVSGSGGCNTYNAAVSSEGDFPQALTTGPVVSTRKACPEPILSQETAYFDALEDVIRWSYLTGRLTLTYENDQGGLGTLLFGPQPAAAAERSPAGDQNEQALPEVTATEVITFVPGEIPPETRSGSCFTSALGLGREDAYRCMTTDNMIYDPCFVVDEAPTVVCGTDPTTGETGFTLTLTEPLPDPELGDLSQPWLVELAGGTICGLLQGTRPGTEDVVAGYGCADQTYLLEDLQQGDVWLAEQARFELGDDGFVLTESETVALRRVWR